MDLPLCQSCDNLWVRQSVTVSYVKRSFLSGNVTQIALRCQNHAFAIAFRNLNQPLVSAGWLRVIDGGDSGPS